MIVKVEKMMKVGADIIDWKKYQKTLVQPFKGLKQIFRKKV